jgi:hypothetical protein
MWPGTASPTLDVMTRTTARTGAGTTTALVLIWIAWVLVPLLLAGAAVASVMTFFGELPTPAEEAQADRLLVAAALVAIGLPLGGILLSAWRDRATSAAAFAVALGIGLLASVPVFHLAAPDRAPSAIPAHSGGGCQEHSGGDTRCPGG